MWTKNVALAGALALAFCNAQAALFDRGGGLIYDDVLNITWLQDANYAKTTGYDADGLMNWDHANTWVSNLVYGGFDDWRLPTLSPSSGLSYDYSSATVVGYGSDSGMRIKGTNAELSYMHYVNLGNDAAWNIDWSASPNCVSPTGNCLVNTGPFINLLPAKYWYGQNFEPPWQPGGGRYWDFNFSAGFQSAENGSQYASGAWAVRDGDVAAPIPEPETYAMMLAGLGLLGFVARRRKQQVSA